MPLIGFQDEAGNRVTFEECWQLEEFAGLPLEVLYAIYLENLKKNRPAGLTVTGLLGCPRKVVLQRQRDYFDNPKNLYPLLRGTMIHRILEGINSLYAPGTILSEQRFERPIPGDPWGRTLSGQIDRYNILGRLLIDYKTIKTERVPKLQYELPEDYPWQANIYKWLLESAGYIVEKIKIKFFHWDYALSTGGRTWFKDGWTTKWFEVPNCPIFTTAQVENFILTEARKIPPEPELPPRVEKDKQWMCKWGCPFKSECWPEGL